MEGPISFWHILEWPRSLVLFAIILAALLSIFSRTRRSVSPIPVVKNVSGNDLPAFVSDTHRKVMCLTSFMGII